MAVGIQKYFAMGYHLARKDKMQTTIDKATLKKFFISSVPRNLPLSRALV
jgi:hypothetical protein